MFKNADYIMSNGILIGCHQGLKKKDIQYIHSTLNQYILKNNEPIRLRFKFFIFKKVKKVFLITGGAISFMVDAFSRNKK